MLRSLFLAGAVSLVALPVWAADMISKPSPHSVSETINRLEAAVTGAGAKVFARVNHGAGAASVDMELADAELLIFGNPKLGTPALQADIKAGLDLPLRVLAYADDSGQTMVVYHDPASLSETHGVPADAQVIQMMTGALDKLTGKAVAAE